MIKILFVCHGNICRSSAAEYVMKDIIRKNGVEEKYHVESKGTSAEELGNGMYPPMARELERMGINSSYHRARRMKKEDYNDFDIIIGMDEENRYNMRRMWKDDPQNKLHLLLDYTDKPGEVYDPWYTRDFKQALSDIVFGCKALFSYLAQSEESEYAKHLS